MTKALVTIEVDIDTAHTNIWRGLGDSSNPEILRTRHKQDLQRDWIWDQVHLWVKDQLDFVRVTKVSLVRESGE